MLIIDSNSKHLIKKLNLHDAAVSEVICNYQNKTISFPLQLESNIISQISFDNVLYTDITLLEPWGTGFYIFEISINDDIGIKNLNVDNTHFNTSFLLNSGDRINIIASKLIYDESINYLQT